MIIDLIFITPASAIALKPSQKEETLIMYNNASHQLHLSQLRPFNLSHDMTSKF